MSVPQKTSCVQFGFEQIAKQTPTRVILSKMQSRIIKHKVITPQLSQLNINLIQNESSASCPQLQKIAQITPQLNQVSLMKIELEQIAMDDFDDQIQQLLTSRFEQLNMHHSKKFDVEDMFNELNIESRHDSESVDTIKETSSLISPQFTLTNITGLDQEEIQEFELHQNYLQ